MADDVYMHSEYSDIEAENIPEERAFSKFLVDRAVCHGDKQALVRLCITYIMHTPPMDNTV